MNNSNKKDHTRGIRRANSARKALRAARVEQYASRKAAKREATFGGRFVIEREDDSLSLTDTYNLDREVSDFLTLTEG
jgi:hypothetical protein